MTSENEAAEELMRKIEKAEDLQASTNPSKRFYHLCIVNLVIGTLYCSKGNYEFGISRIIKAMEPFNKKLGTDTWFYAKRCFVSFYEALSKQMIVIKDELYKECLEFFDRCELHGRDIPVMISQMKATENGSSSNDKNSVSYEARLIKALFTRLND